ncbi:general odorant-binding protein 19d-like [Homalodisca vitripennis]|uniref:general odorant-binding protein 19d-like n=1 Tax=Homalodisca vitripennis TaxID=197043 RepID=UPI001EEAC224|nr:general odorant-binding protein 19d-like [Homalodisca vitripennis]
MHSQGLLFAVLLATIAFAKAKYDVEEAEKHFNLCKEETGAEENFAETYKSEVIPSSDKGKCLLECVMRHKGVYDKDGKFDLEGLKKYAGKVFEHKPENVEKMIAIAEECHKLDVEGLDKCEAAYKYATCCQTKSREQNISFKD